MTTQTNDILRHMQTEGEISPWVALREYGCMRLAARISEIRGMGYNVRARREVAVNRFGRKINYAVYSLEVGA